MKKILQRWLGIDALQEHSQNLSESVSKLSNAIAYCDVCGQPVLLNQRWEWDGVRTIAHSEHHITAPIEQKHQPNTKQPNEEES